jgi:hypothetical protein
MATVYTIVSLEHPLFKNNLNLEVQLHVLVINKKVDIKFRSTTTCTGNK